MDGQLSLDAYIESLQALRAKVGGATRVVVKSDGRDVVGDPVLSVARLGKTTPYKLVSQRGVECVLVGSDR